MRVAFDTSSTRGRKTGIGVYTEDLISALRRYVPDVQVVELDDRSGSDQRTDKRIFREQVAIPRLTRASGAQVLHLTGFAAPFRPPSPVVITAMDLIGMLFARNFPIASRFYWSRYLPFTLRFATRVITLSENTKNDIVRLAGIDPSHVTVIPPGRNEAFRPINDQEFLKNGRQRLELPSDFVLFVSTLEPRKGVDTLIDAFGQVAGRVTVDLVIVGKRGWYWDSFYTHVKQYRLESRVHFFDYLEPADLPLVYNLARVFVFPSRYEGFGLPVLEAMACGTPVISSNASSLREVVGNAGLLVSPDNVSGLAGSILRVLGDPNLQKRLRECGLEQADKFSWERAARETAGVYDLALKERSTSFGNRPQRNAT